MLYTSTLQQVRPLRPNQSPKETCWRVLVVGFFWFFGARLRPSDRDRPHLLFPVPRRGGSTDFGGGSHDGDHGLLPGGGR